MKTGELIMNSSGSIAEVGSRYAKYPRWKCGGWEITRLNTGTGDGYGSSEFLPDYLANNWRPAPRNWSPVPQGSGLEERWVYQPAANVWRRELRKVEAGL
jgi:hypothetical protein